MLSASWLTDSFGVAYVDHPTIILYDRGTGSSLNILPNAFIFL